MIGSPSSEFITLCQSQVLLLTQALGAASTVVYLVEATVETINPTLIPLVAYPETANLWHDLREGLAAVFNPADEVDGSKQFPTAQSEQWLQQSADSERDSGGLPSRTRVSSEKGFLSMPFGVEPATQRQGVETDLTAYPLVLPLAHDGVVLGMIVSTREALPWTADDYRRAEQVASTLAIAYVLDQRSQWLQRQLNQRQLTQADQSETFHDLLHQFRNPLTALQTFGKLMVKRLPPEDTNRPIVEGIVRESRRLQDLAQHFDAAVAEGDETLEQTTTPPAGRLLLPGSPSEWSDRPRVVIDSDNTLNSRLATAQGQPLEALASTTGHGLGRSLRVQPGAIAEIALPLVQSLAPLAHERGLHLVHHIPTPLPRVWLDAAALGEVLHNLLDNALKYAPAGSLIWVTAGLVQRIGRQMFQGIAVGDTGAGIPLGDQPQLFTRHFRGVRAQGDIPGTGLGLAIVQDLVQGMGGRIDLVSPVQGTPWLPPEAVAYPQNPGVVFVVWLKALDSEVQA
ncbi:MULTISPECIES: HAMP domain-containing sensor histidine kinase [Cyanophyceae]|uniref:sensor histidine kinase n=1 Tax=Cyanophyceae TaxID=3028117 RepID=UPI0016848A4A|nr:MULTISPECIES: HAMP domain-containing sensor histidine kinase [Cyanophyceae]MBD1915075.1 HAMP domain-containing histidine kinase [Phormidium sp. FACHB-77]MBD2029742.1 HAMP domain-containing histidine kinase [Phormidium sp. FACHB-322]MBD2050435.1 HAMP domain-containing histidine kinase [Leptolyngbya sp. FACHB-60]